MTGKHTIYCSKVLFLMRHEFTTPFIRGRCPFDNVLNKNQPAFDRTKSTRLKKLSRAYSGAQQQLVLCGCDLKPASRHTFFSKTNFASLHERAYSSSTSFLVCCVLLHQPAATSDVKTKRNGVYCYHSILIYTQQYIGEIETRLSR